MFKNIKELLDYRNMIITYTGSEIKSRYKGSFLGIFWALLNPIFLLMVYGFVFSIIMRGRIENYFLFLGSGLLPWIFFRSAILGSANSIISNASLIKKIYFPREILPISTVLNHLINYLISLLVLLPSLFLFGDGVGANIIYLPYIIVVHVIMTIGLSIVISSLTVYFRDVRQILEVVMMAMFYYTPILYTSEMIPPKYLALLNLNPLKPIIQSYQDVLFFNRHPDFVVLFIILTMSLILVYMGFKLFNNLQKSFAEKI